MNFINDFWGNFITQVKDIPANKLFFLEIRNNPNSLRSIIEKNKERLDYYYQKKFWNNISYFNGFINEYTIIIFEIFVYKNIFIKYINTNHEDIFTNGYINIPHLKNYYDLIINTEYSSYKNKLQTNEDSFITKVKKFFLNNFDSEKIYIYPDLYFFLFDNNIFTNFPGLIYKIFIKKHSSDQFSFEANLKSLFRVSNKTDLFFIVLYNYLQNEKLNTANIDFVANYKILIDKGLIKQKNFYIYDITFQNVGSRSSYKHYPIFESRELIALLFTKSCDLDFQNNLILFHKDLYTKYVDNNQQLDIVNIDQIDNNLIKIGSEHKIDIHLEKKFKIIQYFLDNGNINNKNVKINKGDIQKFQQQNQITTDNIDEISSKLFQSKENYKILITPLYQSLKRFVISNVDTNYFYYPTIKDKINLSIYNTFKEIYHKYQDKYLDIESFRKIFFKYNTEIYNYFFKLQKYYSDILNEKLEGQGRDFFDSNCLLNNYFIYLAHLGFVNIYGAEKHKTYYYYSSSGYYSNYSEKEFEWTNFEVKYVQLRDIDTLKAHPLPTENHISGNKLYISLMNKLNIFEELAQFTILDKVDDYLVFEINKDVLIKAKNIYKLSAPIILKFLDNLKIKISKNIEVMIETLDTQKNDLILCVPGISIIIDTEGLYRQILNLSMFKKYIIYHHDELKLIIFNPKFKGLENLLNKRKILFKKVGEIN